MRICLKFLARVFRAALIASECKKGVSRQHTTLTSYQMLLVPTNFFFWCVDYALEGSTFKLSKCDFRRFFSGWEAVTHIMTFLRLLFLVGMICPLMHDLFWNVKFFCERFEPRSHFISRLSLIVRVNVFLNRTVVDSDWLFNNLCGSYLQSQSQSITSTDGIKLWLLTWLVD